MGGRKREKACFKEGSRVLSLLVLIACSCWSIFMIFNLSPNSPTLQENPISLKHRAINDDVGGPSLRREVTRLVPGEESEPTKQRDSRRHRETFQTKLGAPIHCDRSHELYDICSVNGPTVLDPATSTFYVMGPAHSPTVEKVKPYPRKFEAQLMSRIREVMIVSGPKSPQCQAQHEAPALVFSAGGYTGNFFHEFNEGFIPLFVTVSTIFQDHDIIIVVSEAPDWWLVRYQDLLKAFTKFPIIVLQNGTNVTTHCFPSATIGLLTHGSMSIDQNLLPNVKTIHHFRGLLDRAFSQNFTFYFNRKSALPKPRRPRLVFIGRSDGNGRAISNQDEVVKAIESVGFHVVVLEPIGTEWLCESYALLSESHAMVGVHGAALTHLLFLRPGSIFVQVVPLGIDWAAEEYFGRVGRELKLDYFEYKIGMHESSLLETYGKGNALLRNARSLQKGWPADVMDIYLRKQNVKIDIVRFRSYMKKAYVKARKFMRKSPKRNYIF